MRILIAVISLMLAAVAPAKAATTVYAAGVFAQSGTVTNPNSAFGPANGAAATIGGAFSFFGFTFGFPGQVTYSFSQAVTGAGLQLSGLGGGVGSPTVAIAIGEIVSGVAVFSTETTFTGGAGAFNFNLSAQCAGINATGCSLLRIRTIGGFGGGTFLLDGVSGVSAAPEPATWMMMFAAFGAVAWRLKKSRPALKAIPA